MKRYSPKDIEPKWQKQWQDTKIYQAADDAAKPKNYILDFFPYPSGAAMHVGHVRNYTISDVVARFARQRGQNVLHPMGWDAFGLPAENYAIKTGIPPAQAVAQNTGKFKQQLDQMGISIDWTREINSSDPSYYKWTQWFFKLLFERGLAYQKESLQWWCETDKTVLANEQVEAGRCWRCGNEVTKKPLKQWFFKITDYADRLVEDLDNIDWSDAIKTMQRNWIGRSDGMLFTAPIKDANMTIQTFSAHFEAFAADTFVVIAPDHPRLKELVEGTPDAQKVLDYAAEMVKKRDLQGYVDDENVDGIFTGRYIVDPIGNGDLPIWVASYALADYGTGIVKCSAHDERDFRFAKKYNIRLKPVLFPKDAAEAQKVERLEVCYTDMQHGVLKEPQAFAGVVAGKHREQIINYLVDQKLAEKRTSYKIRDWLISRQRYWGAPIPIIYCPDHGAVPVPDNQLPVELPPITDYQPSGDGRSPLAKVKDWVNTTCPQCGKPALRETDTMDGFACSSWYFLRFADPHNNQKPFDADKAKYWLPVDTYVGGAEHAVMHLLYARFWTKVMHDARLIDFTEPFTELRNHGMILASDGRKMSKSYGNVIAPDELIADGYGADSIRVMELFIAPWNQQANWSTEGLGGCFRFLQRFWTLAQEVIEAKAAQQDAQNTAKTQSDEAVRDLQRVVHKTVKKVTEDIEGMGFNTAIAAMMEAINELYKLRARLPIAQYSTDWRQATETLSQLLAPFAPHLAEEIWHQLGHSDSVHVDHWPTWDESYLVAATVPIVVQVNGRVRATLQLPADVSEADVTVAALADPHVQEFVAGQPKRVIYVPGRLVNVVL